MILFKGENGDRLHDTLCRAFGIPNKRGSRRQVAEALGIRPQHYSKYIVRAVCPWRPVTKWCQVAGLRYAVDEDGVIDFWLPADEDGSSPDPA